MTSKRLITHDFLLFRRMLAPILIQVLFWIAVMISIITGISDMFRGEFLVGLQILVFGPIVARVFCEILILFFRINETLTEIRDTIIEELEKK